MRKTVLTRPRKATPRLEPTRRHTIVPRALLTIDERVPLPRPRRLLNAWLKAGHNIILDRYVEANFGHQASKLTPDERPALIRQLGAFEHDWLDLPRAHRVVYLDLPPAEALKAMATDGTRAALDIHETAGDDYKSAVRSTFLWCARHVIPRCRPSHLAEQHPAHEHPPHKRLAPNLGASPQSRSDAPLALCCSGALASLSTGCVCRA